MQPCSARFNAVLRCVTDGYYTLDTDWRFSAISPDGAEHFKRRPEELLGKSVWSESGLGPGSEVYQRFCEAVEAGQPRHFEIESHLSPGEWYEVHLLPHEEGLDVFFRNITPRKNAQAALYEAAEHRALALEIANLGTWEFEEIRGVVRLDERSRQLLGLGPEHRLDEFFEIIHADDLDRVRKDVGTALDPHGEGRYESEHRVCHPEGTVWVSARGRIVSGSRVPGRRRFLGTLMDTTAEQAAAASLREGESRQAFLLRLSDAIRPLEDPGDIQYAACRVLGEALRVNRVMYMEVSSETEGLVRHDYVSGVGSMAGRFPLSTYGEDIIGILRSGEPLVMDDVTTDSRLSASTREAFRGIDVGAGMAIGLVKADRLVATFSANNSAPRRWTSLDLALLQETAERTWAALERARAESALRSFNARLAEADKKKDEFLAVLSHELRNPLAPILYALPILGGERIGQAAKRAVAIIDRQVWHLARLVDDLLDLSRITRGKITLRREHVTVAAAVNTAVEAASPAMMAARHQFDLRLPTEPIHVYADPARIAQVITNLLNNSAKYTPRGGSITLSARREGSDAIICVRDNGIGIPAESLQRVFEMFQQVSSPDKSQGGLGIGLSLAKRLIEMHGGTIEARSAGVGLGAEFLVRLPVATEVRTEAPPSQRSGATALARKLRVLVVDDNADLVEMLGFVLESAGHEVRKALDGRSAVSAALAFHPDVVLLDIGLPVLNGIEVAKRLREQPATASARLVALTGWGQPEDRRETNEAGFDAHLTKPTDPAELLRLLVELTSRASE